MFQRFASACVIASIVIAGAALTTLLLTQLLKFPVEVVWILTTAWCCLPIVWGLWAMLAPSGWVPNRLGTWGAILGVAVGVMAGPVLNIPYRLGAPSGLRWIALAVGPVLYYVLWLLVGVAYRSLERTEQVARSAKAA